MLSTVKSLRLIQANLARAKAAAADAPAVTRETNYFLARITGTSSARALVGDTRLFAYAMKAHGLGDMIYAKALMQRMMEGGLANPDSPANRVADPRFRAFVGSFNFGDLGTAAARSPRALQPVVTAFVDQTFEDNIGQQSPGAKLALYFQRLAPSITGNIQILADRALAEFARTALDLPATAATSVETDLAALDKALKPSDLRDPAKLDRLIVRFASRWDVRSGELPAGQQVLLTTSRPVVAADMLLRVQRLYLDA